VRILGVLLLATVALMLLAAHFFRAGSMPVAVLCLLSIALCHVRRPWAARVLQIVLALGVIEWIRTTWIFASARAAEGEPYARLLAILGAVALVTALAAVALQGRAARRHFGRS
jgi:hypothetical protein